MLPLVRADTPLGVVVMTVTRSTHNFVRTTPCSACDAGAQAVLDATRTTQHPDCILCGGRSGLGFGLQFRADAPGKVYAVFSCNPLLQSYPRTLHGGVTAALLDASMTNCLFSLGVVAVTAEITVRYLNPIDPQDDIELFASREQCHPPLHCVRAEAVQNGKVVARAKAKFVERGTPTPRAPVA
jgi:acyl-coenzyme A thioesterase PaaI-like protein